MFEALKTIISLLTMLPSVFKLVQEVEKAIKDMESASRAKDELKRQQAADENAEKLKKAIEARDEKATDDALNGVIDDYNRGA